MNPALFHLIRLQGRGFFRRITRSALSPRRAVFLAVGIALMMLWLGPPVLTSLTLRHTEPQRLAAAGQRFRGIAPLALLAICVLIIVSSAGDKAVSFTPGEVDILFPGPFTRRQLLGYKLSKSGLVALLTGLVFSFPMLVYGTSWIASYVGVVLTLLFIQWFSTAGVLLGQTLSQRANTMMRQGILIVAIFVGFILVRHWIAAGGGTAGLLAFRDSELGEKLLAPFDPFGRAITADGADELLTSAGEAALVDAGLLAIVVLLDANYLEAAMAASQRRHAQLQRIRAGSLLSSSIKGDVKWRLPQPPWLLGAGPIAWRQATSAARSAKGLLLVLLILALGAGPLLAHALESKVLVGLLAYATVLLSGMLKFDFRGDLDHMEELKALPVRPVALACGQIVVPALVLSAVHVLLLGSVAAMIPSERPVLLVAACLAPPFNLLLMATENLIFLLFPTRPAAASPGDLQVLGRQAAQILMKAIAVMLGCLLAAGFAVPLYIFTGGSLVLLVLLGAIILLGEVCALVPAIGWAFRRFDPSIDTPA